MDKICLELDTFEEFATAVLQSLAKRCLSSRDHFLKKKQTKSAAETNGAYDGRPEEKNLLNRCLRSIVSEANFRTSLLRGFTID